MEPTTPTSYEDHSFSTPPRLENKPGNHIPVISVAVFILLSLAAVIFLYYQNQRLKSILVDSQSSNQLVNQSASPAPTPNLHWRTYTNNDFNFTFEYPDEMFLKDVPKKDVIVWTLVHRLQNGFLGRTSVTLTISDSPFPDLAKNKAIYQLTSKELNINNIGATKYTYGCGEGCYESSIRFKNDKQYFEIKFDASEAEIDNLMDQILSSFKFISPTPSPTPTNGSMVAPTMMPYGY